MSSDWRKEYPSDWETVAKRILIRDQFRCRTCQLRQYSVIHRPALGAVELWGVTRNYNEGRVVADMATRHTGKRHILVVLAACHWPDPSPFNVADSNLLTLCQWDHHRVDVEMRRDNRRATWKRKWAASGKKERVRKVTVEDTFGEEDEDDGDIFESFYRY